MKDILIIYEGIEKGVNYLDFKGVSKDVLEAFGGSKSDIYDIISIQAIRKIGDEGTDTLGAMARHNLPKGPDRGRSYLQILNEPADP